MKSPLKTTNQWHKTEKFVRGSYQRCIDKSSWRMIVLVLLFFLIHWNFTQTSKWWIADIPLEDDAVTPTPWNAMKMETEKIWNENAQHETWEAIWLRNESRSLDSQHGESSTKLSPRTGCNFARYFPVSIDFKCKLKVHLFWPRIGS